MAEPTSAPAAPRDWRLVAADRRGCRLCCASFCDSAAGRAWPAPRPTPGPFAAVGLGVRAGRARAGLRTHNQRMRVALDNMSQGLCMFDGNERLVVCNQRYIEMYELAADIVKPGMTLHGLLEYRNRARHLLARRRRIPARAARAPWPAGKTTQHRSQIRRRPHHSRSPTGRCPTAAGSATHEDITERRDAERERAAMQSSSSGAPYRAGDLRLPPARRGAPAHGDRRRHDDALDRRHAARQFRPDLEERRERGRRPRTKPRPMSRPRRSPPTN